MSRNRIMVVIGIILLLGGGFLFISQTGAIKRQDGWTAPALDIPVVSTRGHFHDGELAEGRSSDDYDLLDVTGGQPFWDGNPEDIIVVIHGFNNSTEKANAKFRIAELSLRSQGYAGAIVGFSWDANTQQDPFGTTGYHAGRRNAVANGAKLASFIADCRSRQPQARIHLIGYSMGARVALETLLVLSDDPGHDGAAVDSVHLVGAAVDNEEVELSKRYGRAIEVSCSLLVNYFSREDNALGMFYPFKEADRALGETDIEHADLAPENYRSIDIEAELHEYDNEQQPAAETGDNHSACLGNLGADGSLLDDGIMDVVLEQIASMKPASH